MTQSFVLGLTGSVGMGKSTTASMFADEGVPVWDADAVVHGLYEAGGAGVPAVAALCEDCVQSGAVDRARLKRWLAGDPDRLKQLEAAIHPLVAQDRADFIEGSTARIVLLDIPLLFEIGADTICNAVVVVSAPADIQRARVMERPGMTEAHFTDILARQMPDADKRARADYVVETLTLDGARQQVQDVLRDIRDR